jgi:NADH-quinone oxidoreductase subunit A
LARQQQQNRAASAVPAPRSGAGCPAAKRENDRRAGRGGEDGRARVAGPNDMLEQYLPILLFIAVGLILGAVLLAVGSLVSPNRPDPQKLSPYECGFEAFEDARMKFDVRYYLVAILFILFDLEIAFLFPWAVVLPEIGFFGFAAMMVFLAILVVGFVYEWKKGALEWE